MSFALGQLVLVLLAPPEEGPVIEPAESAAPATPLPPASPWVIGGFVDTAYLGNTNAPDNHVYRGMFTSPRTNEFTLNLAALYVRRDAGERDPFHLELALQVGPAADALVSGEPNPGGADSQFAGAEVWKHLARANAGLTFRTGTDVTAGVMVSPVGLGVAWTLPNWTYTTPWTLNAVPYYLLGGRVGQQLGKHVELQAWLVNGWQTMGDVNKVPAYLAVMTIKPTPALVIQQLGYFGPEDVDPSLDAWRVFSNTQLTWNLERFGFAGLFDVGRERVTALPGQPIALWMGITGMTRARVLGQKHTWDMATRAGAYWDRDGRMFAGGSQWLLEAVYTNDVRLFSHVLLRIEYRYDHSTASNGFFYRQGATHPGAEGLARDQHTILGALTGYFELGLPEVPKRR